MTNTVTDPAGALLDHARASSRNRAGAAVPARFHRTLGVSTSTPFVHGP